MGLGSKSGLFALWLLMVITFTSLSIAAVLVFSNLEYQTFPLNYLDSAKNYLIAYSNKILPDTSLDTIRFSIIAGIIISSLIYFFFYFFSVKLMLRWYKAKKLENDAVVEIVTKLAKKAGIRIPEVYVTEIEMPNAFALGSRNKGKIILSKSLIDILDADELEAVLAHEIAHIKNNDTVVSGIIATIAGIIVALSTLAYWISLFTGFGEEDDPAPNLIRLFVLSLVSPFAAFLVYLFVPLSREYKADDVALEFVDRDNYIRALEKIQRNLRSKIYDVNFGHAHIFTVNPLWVTTTNILDFTLPTYATFFNTNPSILNRLSRLKGTRKLEKVKMKNLFRPMFYTFMSNMAVLFAIIVFDTFNRKDFDFSRALHISVIYVSALFIFLQLFLVVFLLRRRP